MKYSALLIIILLTAFRGFSIPWEAVKNNSEYVYGEGSGATVAEADREALSDLISKISTHVASGIELVETEIATKNDVDYDRKLQSVVNTYSQLTLNNTEKVILKNEPGAKVGRYIKRDEINKIFKAREARVKDYVASAEKAEAKGKIDVALKDYYWALTLLKTLQYPSSVKYETEDGDDVMLLTWIPHQINEIFSNISAKVINRDGDDVEVFFAYKANPVSAMDYTFFDGRDWSNIYSAKDGIGVLELAKGNQSNNYQIKVEYEYRGEAHVDRDVETVLKIIPAPSLRGSYLNIKSDYNPKAAAKTLAANNKKNEPSGFSSISADSFSKPTEITPPADLKEAADKVIASITSKSYAGVEGCFTSDGFDIYRRLIQYGQARIVGRPDLRFYRTNNGIIARGVQMSFSFRSGLRKSFVEDIVFSFDKEGKIDNIAFGLGKTAEDDVLGKGVWSEQARFAILNFLENYQTAYALKRLDYIESVFDDDAIIITATVSKAPIRRASGDSRGLQIGGDIIKYNRHTKDSYLKQLAKSFASKEYINLRFANNDIRKLGKGGELYAIQISQEYYSSNYGDKGYLFLMVDINDPENPIIKVRTWQPEKDPNFGLYGPEDFN